MVVLEQDGRRGCAWTQGSSLATFARLADRPLRVLRVPAAATRLVLGPVLADYLQADAVFSNIRLRGLGFHFRYPTLEQGLQEVLGALDE